MSSVLKEWVSNIFIAVLVISFIEVILPSGNMRKYLKFILSIILLAIILQPLLEYKDIKYSAFTELDFTNESEKEVETQEIATIQNIQIVSVFKLKIVNEISGIVYQILPEAQIQDIKVAIFENVNKKNFGDIHSIYLDIASKNHNDANEQELLDAISKKLNLGKRKISINIHE